MNEVASGNSLHRAGHSKVNSIATYTVTHKISKPKKEKETEKRKKNCVLMYIAR